MEVDNCTANVTMKDNGNVQLDSANNMDFEEETLLQSDSETENVFEVVTSSPKISSPLENSSGEEKVKMTCKEKKRLRFLEFKKKKFQEKREAELVKRLQNQSLDNSAEGNSKEGNFSKDANVDVNLVKNGGSIPLKPVGQGSASGGNAKVINKIFEWSKTPNIQSSNKPKSSGNSVNTGCKKQLTQGRPQTLTDKEGSKKRRNDSSLKNPTASKAQKLYAVNPNLCIHVKKKDNISFNDNEFLALKKFIIDLQDAIPDEDFYPVFNRTSRIRNFVSIECTDSKSVEWLEETLPGVELEWEYGAVSVLRANEIPKLIRAVFVIPSGLDDSWELNKFNSRIKKANRSLILDSWEFWKVEDNKYGGKVIFYGVDPDSADYIKKNGGTLFYLTGKLQVKIGLVDSQPNAKFNNH